MRISLVYVHFSLWGQFYKPKRCVYIVFCVNIGTQCNLATLFLTYVLFQERKFPGWNFFLVEKDCFKYEGLNGRKDECLQKRPRRPSIFPVVSLHFLLETKWGGTLVRCPFGSSCVQNRQRPAFERAVPMLVFTPVASLSCLLPSF